MKKLLATTLAVVITSACAPATVVADECDSYELMAKTIMIARQSNLPKQLTLMAVYENLDDDKVINLAKVMIDYAYKVDIQETEQEQLKLAGKYGKLMYQSCKENM